MTPIIKTLPPTLYNKGIGRYRNGPLNRRAILCDQSPQWIAVTQDRIRHCDNKQTPV